MGQALGLYAYVGFAVLRPQAIFSWAGDLSNISFIVGVATLIGWALQGFGSWRFGRAKSVVVALVLFVVWFALSGLLAVNPSVSFASLWEVSKFVLPVLVGVTMLETEIDRRRMLWTIVLAQGYVGFEMNLAYLYKGYNLAAKGFAGMDNNCFGAGLVTVIGPAVALTIVSKTWYERAAASSAAVLILHTTLLTFSRGAMVGLVAVAVTAFVMMPKRPRHMVAVLVVVLLAIRLTGPQLAERYSTTFAGQAERDGSAESRIDLWRDCLLVIQAYPVFGVGPGNWRIIASQYGWPEGKSAHSVWMETAAENGIPGALLLFLFFGLAGAKLWPIARERLTDANRYETALAASVVLGVVGFSVSGQFVSVPGLEVPYYVVMVGAAMLKNRQQEAPATVATPSPKGDLSLPPTAGARESPARCTAAATPRPTITGRSLPRPARPLTGQQAQGLTEAPLKRSAAGRGSRREASRRVRARVS